MTLNIVSLFSGIGAFEKGLSKMGIDYNLLGFSEVDPYAIRSYCAIHGVDSNKNMGDISKIKEEDMPKDVDLVTYGFPCQDLSIAGEKRGIGRNTRSGLLYEAERVIRTTKPRYAIAENVKNMISKTFISDFKNLLERLDSYGYNNYWGLTNAKDFGSPQGRERVFIVSIRKDIDDGKFIFPEGDKSTFTPVSSIIDLSVSPQDRKVTSTLKPYFTPRFFKPYNSKNGIKKLFDGVAQGYFKSSYSLRRIYSIDGICPTLTTSNMHHFYEIGGRLTPRELFRVMGFEDKDFDSIDGVSDTQLIKQAGNSIAVPVVESIFKNLLKGDI